MHQRHGIDEGAVSWISMARHQLRSHISCKILQFSSPGYQHEMRYCNFICSLGIASLLSSPLNFALCSWVFHHRFVVAVVVVVWGVLSISQSVFEVFCFVLFFGLVGVLLLFSSKLACSLVLVGRIMISPTQAYLKPQNLWICYFM